nr:DNA replication licensing factor MCM4 [Paratrimastix eleionoma]
MSIIEENIRTNNFTLNVDGRLIHKKNPSLYRAVISYPRELLPMWEMKVKDCAILIANRLREEEWNVQVREDRQQRGEPLDAPIPPPPLSKWGEGMNFLVRFYNLMEIRQLQSLNPIDIDKLVSIEGMVIRTTQLIPDIRQAWFQCIRCDFGQAQNVERGRVVEPNACASCRAIHTMQLIHNRSSFTDKQIVRLQEASDHLADGDTPQTLSAICYASLVDLCNPGDRVILTGIYRAQPVRVNSHIRSVCSVYNTYLEVIHVRKTVAGKLKGEITPNDPESDEYIPPNATEGNNANGKEFTQEQVEKLVKLSQAPDIYDQLVHSLAPSIYGMEDVKKGILCQLFGGVNRPQTHSSLGRCRGEINVLLVGDPGTSKSQLLKYVNRIAPRGIYTSGKGSSAVGLTAYVNKDPETKELILESGALVLSDRGICCIDEFDKMSDYTRTILHEVMEQQTISVAKAGIVCTLNARTAILAAANPRTSRYEPKLSVVDNIALPPTLLSRFDLIYLILDNPDEAGDRRLARHIISLFYQTPEMAPHEIDLSTLNDYVAYARSQIHPKITDEAAVDLVEGYRDLRKMGSTNPHAKTVAATPRQLESIIRISEAHARMRFSPMVEPLDVAEAIRLVKVALKQSATDPTTGLIDYGQLATGRSAAREQKITDFTEKVLQLLQTKPTAVWKACDIVPMINDHLREEEEPMAPQDLDEIIRDLNEKEKIDILRKETRYPSIRLR